MSSKLATKSMKRASSISKKKGAGGTPDTIISARGTPTTSASSIGIDKPHESTIDDVLTGDEIQALRIKEEDLGKIHPPKRPISGKRPQHTRKVIVKRSQPSIGTEMMKQKEREVAVLHPLPPGTAVTATRTIGSVDDGPRFDQRGTFISHSVLGQTGDYATELKNEQMIESTSMFSQPPPITLPDVRKRTDPKRMSYEKTILPREKHALNNWDESMEKRKTQQNYLAYKVGSSSENLVMNQGDGYRTVQEERMLVDRAMAAVNYGKGYRVESEFWSQHVKVGDESTGIHTTLTRTERGLPPELEFVGVPAVVRNERGISSDLERNAPFHYTWDQSPYLSTRREQLDGLLMEVHRPEISELQVIGRAPSPDVLVGRQRMRTDSLDSLGECESASEGNELPGSILDLHSDISLQPIIGPALLLNGQLLKWEGAPLLRDEPDWSKVFQMSSRATQSETALKTIKPRDSTSSLKEHHAKGVSFHSSPIDFRVTFESDTGAVTTSHLELENCGTAAVYYSWQPLPKPNPLGTIQAGDTQRFFFDTRGGVLLPGKKLAFPFVFKSPNAGIFSEMWLIQTGPVLCRGRPILFTLKGVAFQDDLNKEKREELERELKHRMAVSAAERLVNRLVDSIRMPPQFPETVKTIEMEEDVFRAKNPEFYYHHSVVQQLKTLYDSILRPERLLQEQVPHDPSSRSDKSGAGKRGDDKAVSGGGKGKDKLSGKDKKASKGKEDVSKEETLSQAQEEECIPQVPDWDLSIASLQEVILAVEDEAIVEGKLKELSSLVGALSFPPPKQIRRSQYNIVYEALCEALDQISNMSTNLCQTMGLPVREFTHAKDEAGISNGDKPIEPDGTRTPSLPASPAHIGKDKKGSKDSKKTDKLKMGSSKNKSVPPKKSKSNSTLKESGAVKEEPSATVPVEVDPILKNKYKENFNSAVYEILGNTADKIASLLEEMC